MQTDPIADMLTRIRNASHAKHARVDLPASKMKVEIARILKDEGYLASYKVVDDTKVKKTLRVYLRYTSDRRSVISNLKRVSTPRGLMTGQTARKEGVGGELLCEVW